MNKMISFALAVMPLAFVGACVGEQSQEEEHSTTTEQELGAAPQTDPPHCWVQLPTSWVDSGLTCTHVLRGAGELNPWFYPGEDHTVHSNTTPNTGSITYHCDGNLQMHAVSSSCAREL